MKLFAESHSGWAARSDMEGGYDIVDANGAVVATLHYDYRHTSNATNRLRAAMLAAAPEVLSALDELVLALDLPGDHCEVEQAKRHAKATLAKARGASEQQGPETMSSVHVTLEMAHQMVRDAVAAEREECAKIADAYPTLWEEPDCAARDIRKLAAAEISQKIRART